MLTSLHIENFKGWKDTGKVRLAPLTVVFGANSTGKSSIGHLLLALKQTVLSADRRQALNLGDANSLIELGTFQECLHNHDVTKNLHFQLGWDLPDEMEVIDPLTNSRFSGTELALDVLLCADENAQPRVLKIQYELLKDHARTLLLETFKGSFFLGLLSEQYSFIKKSSSASNQGKYDKFYRIPEQTRSLYMNADFVDDFALQTEAIFNGLAYLGPLREYPKRLYSWSGEAPESVGQKGEYTIAAILSALRVGGHYADGLESFYTFGEYIAHWLMVLGLIHRFRLSPIAEGRKEFEVLIKTHANASEVKLTDVGFGVSQVLPVLVQIFYAPPNSTVWIEQPELHLHPQVQSELADVFIAAAKAKRAQFIVESHSEHFLNRLQRRIAEGSVKPEDVAIYFCKRTDGETELEELQVDEYGEITNWPENFFGDEMADIAARTVAAMQRKMADQK